jgi:hypothetical protein
MLEILSHLPADQIGFLVGVVAAFSAFGAVVCITHLRVNLLK